eukprot:16344-Hanusia_phi.AAC.6
MRWVPAAGGDQRFLCDLPELYRSHRVSLEQSLLTARCVATLAVLLTGLVSDIRHPVRNHARMYRSYSGNNNGNNRASTLTHPAELIASEPDLLDAADENLHGELWESMKEYISANPDVIDHIDFDFRGFKDWAAKQWHNMKDWATGKKKKKQQDEGEQDDYDGASMKMAIAANPNMLDHIDHASHGQLWMACKAFIAANPGLVHDMAYRMASTMDDTGALQLGLFKHAVKGARSMMHGVKHVARTAHTAYQNHVDPKGKNRMQQYQKQHEAAVKKVMREMQLDQHRKLLSHEEVQKEAEKRMRSMSQSSMPTYNTRFRGVYDEGDDEDEDAGEGDIHAFRVPFSSGDNGVLDSRLLTRYSKM